MNSRAKQIQESIRQILLSDWDPIGIKNEPLAQDEYDSYVGGVYRVLASGGDVQAIANHLWRIEKDELEVAHVDSSALLPVAQRLKQLDIGL